MPLFVDGTEIDELYVDGVEQTELFVDGVQVYEKSTGGASVLVNGRMIDKVGEFSAATDKDLMIAGYYDGQTNPGPALGAYEAIGLNNYAGSNITNILESYDYFSYSSVYPVTGARDYPDNGIGSFMFMGFKIQAVDGTSAIDGVFTNHAFTWEYDLSGDAGATNNRNYTILFYLTDTADPTIAYSPSDPNVTLLGSVTHRFLHTSPGLQPGQQYPYNDNITLNISPPIPIPATATDQYLMVEFRMSTDTPRNISWFVQPSVAYMDISLVNTLVYT